MEIRPQARADAPPAPGFRIGALHVNPQEGEVTGPGGTQRLDPKVMGVLVMLAERAGHVIPREELLGRLWPNVVVSDDALTRCLYELRRQLSLAGASDEYRAMVETLPKRGYRLNGTVASPGEAAPATAPAAARSTAAWVAGAVALVAVAIVSVLVWRPFSPPADEPRLSIAVLPFVDMSETLDQQYLGDGLAEEILDKLNQSTELRVIARTSSFWFRDKDVDIAEIARKLDVSHVLEGSVRRSGDELRVTAQLISAQDSSHVWSTTFERKLGDLFAIQDEIAQAIASALKVTLARDPSQPGSRPNLEAFDLVKQGEEHYYRRSPGDLDRAIALFEQAVKIDPSYARAWATLAGAYSLKAWEKDPPSELLRARQGDAALRAVAIDPQLAIAHARLGQYYGDAGRSELADRHFELARQLDPEEPLVLTSLAADAVDAGALADATALYKRVLLRDPMNSLFRQNLGVYQMAEGQLDEALATFHTLADINPDLVADVEIEIPRVLILMSRYEDAAAAVQGLPPGKYRDQAMALLHVEPRHRAAANAALERLEAHVPAPPQDTREEKIMDSVRLAEIYAFRGETDKAFATLTAKLDGLREQANPAVFIWYLRHESRVAPFLKPLHADPRWAAFLGESA